MAAGCAGAGGAGCGAIWLLALSLFFQSCLTSTPRLDRALSPSAMIPRTRGLSVGGVVRTPSMVERESDPDDDQSLRDESERSALRQVLLRHEGWFAPRCPGVPPPVFGGHAQCVEAVRRAVVGLEERDALELELRVDLRRIVGSRSSPERLLQ